MVEKQVCQKCGHVFATTHVGTSNFHSLGRIEKIIDERKCPRCGGLVLWVSETGRALSSKRQIADFRRQFKIVLLWIAILFGLLLISRLLHH